MTFSEIKMLLIFKAMDVYTTIASWLFVASALVIVAIDSKLEKFKAWSVTFPGQLILTGFGCAIVAAAVIMFVLGLADIACRGAATIAVQ